MLEIIGSMFLAMMLFGFINLIVNTFRIRKMVRKYKDDPNVKGVHIVNGKIKIIPGKENEKTNNPNTINVNLENINEQTINENKKPAFVDIPEEMVEDLICGGKVKKKDAYHIMKDNQSFYFCSWDCREKFLKE